MTLLLTTVFALLTLVAATVAIIVLVPSSARDVVRPHAVALGSAITGTATLGSLYLSEVAGYVPCELCWVQRIFMYSLAVILGVAVLRRRADVWAYAAPLAAAGAATSTWHVIVQRLPAAQGSCDPNNPCSAILIERFGFITIPTMAGVAFLSVLALAWASRERRAAEVNDAPSHTDQSDQQGVLQ